MSAMGMITVEEADSILGRYLPIWRKSTVKVETLSAAVLAEDVKSDREYPPFDRVAMDGICVAWPSFEAGLRKFRVAGVIAAGQARTSLTDRETCFEIMTGASLPQGASLVIPYEHIEMENGVAVVTNDVARKEFDNVHRRGADCAAGETIVASGSELNGARWGIATAFGYAKMSVLEKPRVKIISTGDEVVDVLTAPLPHQIRGSNGYALRASLLQAGYRDVEMEHVPDDLEVLRTQYRKDSANFDVLIYSGGISKGKFDLLPQVWGEMGVTNHFANVSQRPGKPMWFGTDEKTKTTVLGLPGNPNPSLICLHRYFIEHQRAKPKAVFARLESDFKFEKKMTYFMPVKVSCSSDAILRASPIAVKSSGEFTALAESDGFLELPREQTIFKAGEPFRYFAWSGT